MQACSDSTTKNDSTGPAITSTFDQYEAYKDYNPVFSSDGTKAVFLSKRVGKISKVYLFDKNHDQKLSLFSEKLGLAADEAQENLVSMNASGTLIALNRNDTKNFTDQIIVAAFGGEQKLAISVPEKVRVSELRFAKGSDEFLTYTLTESNTKVVKVVKLSSQNSELSQTEIGSFAGESHARILAVGTSLRLVSFAVNPKGGNRTAVVRTFDSASNEWTSNPNDIQLSISELERGIDVSPSGLFSVAKLVSPKQRQKLGTSATQGQDIIGEKMVIFDQLKVQNVFSSDAFSPVISASYLSHELAWISSLSSSLDGQFLVLTGLDAYSCKEAIRQFQTLKMIRTSDANTVSINFSRKSGSKEWTGVITKPCEIFDSNTGFEIDTTINKAEIIGRDGEFFLVAIHSFINGDEELRLARFKLDFYSETISELTVSEISANTL